MTSSKPLVASIRWCTPPHGQEETEESAQPQEGQFWSSWEPAARRPVNGVGEGDRIQLAELPPIEPKITECRRLSVVFRDFRSRAGEESTRCPAFSSDQCWQSLSLRPQRYPPNRKNTSGGVPESFHSNLCKTPLLTEALLELLPAIEQPRS
jgi:hypothetical protein